jgi:hypothetical protein
MSLKKTRFVKGIILAPDSIALDGVEGELKVDSATGKIQATLKDGVNPSAARELVTNSQTQTLTNKTLTSPVLDTQVTGTAIETDLAASASSTKLASASAIKTYVDNVAAAQNEASEISYSNTTSGLTATTVQAAIDEVDGNVDNLVTLTGVALDSTDLGSFTGVTIPDGSDIKEALQALETELETKAESSDLSAHTGASTNVHGLAVGSSVVGTTDTQELTNKTLTGASIEEPIRSDVKQDTLANLTTYAASFTPPAGNGQIVFATDEKKMFQVVDGELVSIGGAGIVKLTAGENISANDQVYISTGTGNDSARTAGRIYKADASNDDRADVLGFAPKAITSGAIGEVQTSGNLTGLSGLTAGKIYYTSASTPGAITATPPSANGQWIIPSALAVSASEIVINPVASASSIYVVDSDTSFTIANAQLSPANITGLLFDPIVTQSFSLDYVIYRQTDTASSALAQVGQLRGVYNTQASLWLMSDDFSGQNAGVTFSINPSGQIQYTSSDLGAGANYIGSLKYNIRKTFGV